MPNPNPSAGVAFYPFVTWLNWNGTDPVTTPMEIDASTPDNLQTIVGATGIYVDSLGAYGDGDAGSNHDDSTDIQNAITLAASLGVSAVILGPRTYRIDTGLTLPQGVALVGAGRNISVLKYTGAGTAVKLTNATVSPILSTNGPQVRNLQILGTGSANTGLDLTGSQFGSYTDLLITGFTNQGSGTLGVGIKLAGSHPTTPVTCSNNKFYGVDTVNCHVGIDISALDIAQTDSNSQYNEFVNCNFSGGSTGSIMLCGIQLRERATHNTFTNCTILYAAAGGKLVEIRDKGNTFTGCIVAQSLAGGIDFVTTTTTPTGNTFNGGVLDQSTITTNPAWNDAGSTNTRVAVGDGSGVRTTVFRDPVTFGTVTIGTANFTTVNVSGVLTATGGVTATGTISINGTTAGTTQIGSGAAGAITLQSAGSINLTSALASTWNATLGLTISTGTLTLSRASGTGLSVTSNVVVGGTVTATGGITGPIHDDGGEVFDVQAAPFLAKGDVRFANDVTMTSGSPNVQSGTGFQFTPGDVTSPRKKLIVAGAGVAGAQLTGNVIAYIDAQNVTLDVNASTNVSNAISTIGTDDTAAIQATINAAMAKNGGIVFFPPTAFGYLIGSPGLVIDNLAMGLDYTSVYPPAKITLEGGSSHLRITYYSLSGTAVHFKGVDATTNANAYCNIDNLDIRASSIRPSGTIGVHYENCLVDKVEDTQVFWFATGFKVESSTGVQLLNSQTYGCGIGMDIYGASGQFSWIGGAWDTNLLGMRLQGFGRGYNFENLQCDSDGPVPVNTGIVQGLFEILSDNPTGANHTPINIAFRNVQFYSEQTPIQGNHAAGYIHGTTDSSVLNVSFDTCSWINDNGALDAAAALECVNVHGIKMSAATSSGGTVSTFIVGANVTAVQTEGLINFDGPSSPSNPTLATGAGAAVVSRLDATYSGSLYSNNSIGIGIGDVVGIPPFDTGHSGLSVASNALTSIYPTVSVTDLRSGVVHARFGMVVSQAIDAAFEIRDMLIGRSAMTVQSDGAIDLLGRTALVNAGGTHKYAVQIAGAAPTTPTPNSGLSINGTFIAASGFRAVTILPAVQGSAELTGIYIQNNFLTGVGPSTAGNGIFIDTPIWGAGTYINPTGVMIGLQVSDQAQPTLLTGGLITAAAYYTVPSTGGNTSGLTINYGFRILGNGGTAGGGGSIQNYAIGSESLAPSYLQGKLALGIGVADSALTISGNTTAAAGALPVGTLGHTIGANTTVARTLIDAYASNASLSFRRGAGTANAPTAIQLDNLIGQIEALGYATTAYSTTGRALISMYAAETWDDTHQATYITFSTTPTGASVTPTERVRIDNAGNVGIGMTPVRKLDVTGTFGVVGASTLTGLANINITGTAATHVGNGTAGLTVDAGGLTVTLGGASITGGLTVVTGGATISAGGLVVTSSASAITLASSAASNFTISNTLTLQTTGANTLSVLSGGALTLTGATASALTTAAGALTITSAAAATWSTAAGALSITAAAALNLTGTSIVLTGAVSTASGLTVSSGSVTLTASLASSFTTAAGALTITAAAASTWSTAAGALSITSAAALNLTGTTILLTGAATVATGLTVNGTGLNVTTGVIALNANAASAFTTSAGALTITAAVASTWSTAAGALTLTSAAAATWSTVAGALTITSAAALNLNGTSLVLTGATNINLTGAAATHVGNATAGLTVDAGGLTVTAGGETITAGGLTVTAGGITATSSAGAISLASTAASNITITNTLTIATTALTITPGTTAAKAATLAGGSIAIGAATYTLNSSADSAVIGIAVPTIAGVFTAANAYTLYIAGPPTASGSTLTNPWALGILGNVKIDGSGAHRADNLQPTLSIYGTSGAIGSVASALDLSGIFPPSAGFTGFNLQPNVTGGGSVGGNIYAQYIKLTLPASSTITLDAAALVLDTTIQNSATVTGTQYSLNSISTYPSRFGGALLVGGSYASAAAAAAATGLTVSTGRFQKPKGSDVSSVNDLVLGTDGNYFHITGTTQINRISNASWQSGSEITLYFVGACLLKQNQASGASANKPMLLHGSADYTTAAADRLKFIYDSTLGADGAWVESATRVSA